MLDQLSERPSSMPSPSIMGASALRFSNVVLLAGILVAASLTATAQTVIKGMVTHVEDGDTLTISVGKDRYSIRLADIDAPETCHRARDRVCAKPGQPLGAEATLLLQSLALGKPAVATCRGASFDRTVCYVDAGGVDMSHALAAQGLVWWEPRFGRSAIVQRAAADAKLQRIGLWAGGAHVEPWVWRKQCWAAKDCPGGVN